MGSLGSDDDDSKCVWGNSDADNEDTQRLEFDSQYSPYPGEECDDIFGGLQCFGVGTPLLDDTTMDLHSGTQQRNFEQEIQVVDLRGETESRNHDRETQVVDFHGETQQQNPDEETQVMNFHGETQHGNSDEETQVMDFRGETQQLNPDEETQLMDFRGETQQLNLDEETQAVDFGDDTELLENGGNCYTRMDTQPCEFEDEEAVVSSDEEGTVETQVLTDTEGSTDIGLSEITDKALGSVEVLPTSTNGQDEAESAPVHPVPIADTACTPGSIGRGFTSIRAAALRASGMSARKKLGLKAVEGGDVSSPNGIESSEICDRAVDQQVDALKPNEVYGSNKKLGCSAARKLVLDDIDPSEHENVEISQSTDDGAGEDNSVEAQNCAEGVAGLSYVNSQEPGDLSQANAIDFVEQFLKVNVCDLDLGVRPTDSACGKQDPASSVKGTHKLARKVNARCSLAENGVYDWDDSREDEGGGEFLTRNKEAFFTAHKSLTEPRKPGQARSMQSKKHQKSRNVHDMVMGLAHSEPKFIAGKKMNRNEAKNTKRNLNTEFEEQLSTDPTTVPSETEADAVEKLPAFDVGIDTQMAAEAIEALSNGPALAMNGDNAGNDCGNKLEKKTAKSSVMKKGSRKNTEHPSEIGVATRSKQTKKTGEAVGGGSKICVASRTRSNSSKKQEVRGSKTSQMHKNASNNSKKREVRGSKTSQMHKNASNKRSLETRDELEERTRERSLEDNVYAPAKKQRVEGKVNTFALVTPMTRRKRLSMGTSATASELLLDGPKTKVQDQTVDTDGSRKKRKKCGSEAKEKPVKLTAARDGNRSGGNVLDGSLQLNGNVSGGVTLEKSHRHDLVVQCIPRKRRSKRRVPSPKQQPTKSFDQNGCSSPTAEKTQTERLTQGKPRKMAKSPLSSCTTPVNCRTPINTASPVCVGDEYYKVTCRKNLESSSLMKELHSLTSSGPGFSPCGKGLRKRRDIASVRVLFSHHLDEDIIKHLKKILARLGVPFVKSITDATHFVADEFVRTRNMLMAVAQGKPVVNHLWIESCGQASCYIDEKNYILRDSKKESQLGFNLAVSLAHAIEHPLLEGRRVLITPKTKPGVEILSGLVKAVNGQAFERICRSIFKDEKLRDDLLVLSCEEDYEYCVPLLEKGAEVYSSELLLNGIIIQKLEFQRHRLFSDCVKKTRSSMWLKKDGKKFHQVPRRP